MNIILDTLNLIITSVSIISEFLFVLIISKFTVVWIPLVNWYKEPFYTLKRLTDPYLSMFQDIVPSLFGIDFSSLLAMLFLQCFIA
uniref:hypothetical protein n=1 Tax=Rhodella violacea TaxID=2801 RepID=UPI001FCE2E5D|nr:hypothetical protein MW504_pgp074 [Rhodella violacea]UNJ18102.1 hypothetical protein [Rhodella violacea]